MRTKHFFLTELEAAALLEMMPGQMAYRRAHGGGPRFERSGGWVLYRLAEVVDWARRNKSVPDKWFDRFHPRHFPAEAISSGYEWRVPKPRTESLPVLGAPESPTFVHLGARNAVIAALVPTRSARKGKPR